MTGTIDARVEKRPLLRPALASPYAGSQAQKVVYIGTKTPFLSAVKRVEKLLHLADKRLVQGAARLAQNDQRRRPRRGRNEDDEIGAIAEAVEEAKRDDTRGQQGRHGSKSNNGAGEAVVVKGTGKAIAKVLEIGLWFQQRKEEYVVRLKTSSVSSIDDVSYVKQTAAAEDTGEGATDENETPSQVATDDSNDPRVPVEDATGETVEETRVRKVSVLEVCVSLR